MDLHDALRSRRTIQRFADAPVPEAVVTRALEAAHLAPNHKCTWPWRFTLPGPAAREALLRVNVRLKTRLKPETPELVAALRIKMLNPAHLVVVSQVLSPDPDRAREDYAACACAIQNLQLSVHADGYGAKWSTGGVTTDPETYSILGIDPGVERIVGFVWVGVAEVVPRGPQRPELRAHVRRVP